MRRRLVSSTLYVTTMLCLVGANPALAQEADDEVGTSNQPVPAQTIVVTGTRIRGEVPTGSAAIAVGRDAIETSAAMTVGDLVKEVPAVFNLGTSEGARSAGGFGNFTYAQGINIHGIGSSATLLLLEGRRITPQGIAGTINDVGHIAPNALQQLEIVPDGGSAIYGSDAVAGVANIILRRNFVGAEASGSYGIADDYDEYSAGFIYGTDWGSGHATVAYNYAWHSALEAGDRAYTQSNLTAFGGSDYRTTSCNPGTLLLNGATYALPDGGLNAGNVGDLTAGTTNLCDVNSDKDTLPEVKRHNVVLTLDQELAPGVELFGTGFISTRDIYLKGPYNFQTITVPTTNAFYVSPEAGDQQVRYAFTELPTDEVTGSARLYQGTIGLRADLFSEWQGEVALTHGYSDDLITRDNTIDVTRLNAALADSAPATAFNPYGAPNTAAALSGIGQSRQGVLGQMTAWVFDAQLDGPLFTLPGGDLRVAVGYQWTSNHLDTWLERGTVSVPTSQQSIDFTRKSNSLFGEVQIPVFGPDNAVPGIQRLDINAAVRYDKYNDFGSTTNPKIGIGWQPIDGLTLRGSYGTSFRAPAIVNAHSLSITQLLSITDPQAGGALVTGLAVSGGNPDVGPETATTYSFGADYKASSDNLHFRGSVNYFNVKYEGLLTSLAGNPNLLAEEDLYAGTGIITRNPTPQQVAAVLADSPYSGGGSIPDPVPFIVIGSSVNLGIQKSSGIDFETNLTYDLASGGEIYGGFNGLYFISHKQAATPNASFSELVNTLFNPKHFQGRGILGWRNGTYTAQALVNHVGSYKKGTETVSDWTTIDLHFDADVGEAIGSGGLAEGLTLSFDVKNVFDKDPPFVNLSPTALGPGGFDPTQHSPLGRMITFGIRKLFN